MSARKRVSRPLKTNPWPADAVERRPVAELVPYANNARTHSAEQIAQIAASIKEWGWTVPVLVDEKGGLIAGHGRVLAAKSLGLDDIPVMVARGWTAAQKRAYVLADNRLALGAGWDEGLLKIELGELKGLGFDLALTGFGEIELDALFKTPGLTDPDEAPEVPVDPVSALGDVWLLGAHRLVCGDSTDAPCWYAVRKGKTAYWNGDRKQTTLWQIDKPQKSETGHSTQKPVECMKRPIENNSSPGQAVYEPFSGSGTTIIAGEMTGRHVHAIELSPAYVDVAVTRWQNFTGCEATLEATSRTFAKTSTERAKAKAA